MLLFLSSRPLIRRGCYDIYSALSRRTPASSRNSIPRFRTATTSHEYFLFYFPFDSRKSVKPISFFVIESNEGIRIVKGNDGWKNESELALDHYTK